MPVPGYPGYTDAEHPQPDLEDTVHSEILSSSVSGLLTLYTANVQGMERCRPLFLWPRLSLAQF